MIRHRASRLRRLGLTVGLAVALLPAGLSPISGWASRAASDGPGNLSHLGLRLRDQPVGGRLKSGKGVGNGSMTVSVPLTSPADLDHEALEWLRRAYDENA